jgi:hypothetical protein
MTALGRRPPLAIPLNECLLVAVARSIAAVPVSARPCHEPNVRFRRTPTGNRSGRRPPKAVRGRDGWYWLADASDHKLARARERLLAAAINEGCHERIAGGRAHPTKGRVFPQLETRVIFTELWRLPRSDNHTGLLLGCQSGASCACCIGG